MKAPDKIYVKEFGEGISQMWSVRKSEKTTANTQHEYIRKDALLDWLKAVKADPMIPMNIDRVIEKIESL